MRDPPAGRTSSDDAHSTALFIGLDFEQMDRNVLGAIANLNDQLASGGDRLIVLDVLPTKERRHRCLIEEMVVGIDQAGGRSEISESCTSGLSLAIEQARAWR